MNRVEYSNIKNVLCYAKNLGAKIIFLCDIRDRFPLVNHYQRPFIKYLQREKKKHCF